MYLALFHSFLVIDGFRLFWMGSLPKSIQLILELLKASFLVTLFLLYINDLPDDRTRNIAIFVYDITLYFKCNQASDLWQQVELTFEFQSDLWETI